MATVLTATRRRYTQAEIWAAVEALSTADFVRLSKFARWRVRGVGRNAAGRTYQDLMHEAIIAIGDGRRAWYAGVDFRTHLIGTMRSMSNAWVTKRTEEPYLASELEGQGYGAGNNPLDLVPFKFDPERLLSAKVELDQIRKLLSGNSLALEIINCWSAGQTGSELKHSLGIDEKTYHNAKRQIRRTLEAKLSGSGSKR